MQKKPTAFPELPCVSAISPGSVTSVNTNTRNHPVIRDDGLLQVFLTEPNLEAWRKQSTISLEEESANKRASRVEEMSIPSDLLEKMQTIVFHGAAL